MKKLLCLFLLISCVLALASCTGVPGLENLNIPGLENLNIPGLNLGGSSCTTHIDNNGDLKCDKCEAAVECTSHKDKDKDLKCDKCGADVPCNHKDSNNDGECDIEACDYIFCEHEYSNEYSHNKTHHYFLPTCDCDIDPKDSEAHKDANNDGVCDVCEWDYNHQHTYQPTYSHDATHHWYAPTCGHDVKSSYSAHVDKANDGVCDVCSWDYDHVHTYKTKWSHDENKHWHDPDCDHSIDVQAEGDHLDINNDGLCDVCAWNYDHEHTYDTVNWSSDGENHWHAASCVHTVPGIDVAEHFDEDDNGECDVCEYNVCGPDHVYDEKVWGYNDEKHWHPSVCGHDTPNCTSEAQGHQMDGEGIACTMCPYVSDHVHEFDENVWESGAEGHWHRYTCHSDYISDVVPHVDEEGNDGICDVCKYVMCNHEFDETEWHKDETTHWHAPACDHTVEVDKKDVAYHVDEEGNDGLCDVCEYQMCNHPQLDNEYSHDENYHWNKLAECEHEVPASLKTLHTDCDADADGICDVCKLAFCSHPQSETEYKKDATHHWLKFTECDHVVPVERKSLHEDDNNDGNCDVCGIYCEHTFDTENWSSDADNHWHAADCGHTVEPIDKAAHVDTLDNNGVCDICEYVMCTHTWQPDNEWTTDANNHWHAVTCGHSIDVTGLAPHVDEEGNDGICDVCKYVMCNHTYDTENWLTDKNYHWHETTCGHNVPESAKLPHDDADGDGYCTTCMTQFCTHEYNTEVTEYDGIHHWNPTTCGHPVPESAKVAHTDENNDGFCEGCQNQFCVHTDETKKELDGDEKDHWYKFTDCGHIDYSTVAPHVDSNNDNKCDVCEKNFVSNDLDVDPDNPIETPPFVVTPKQEG